MLQANSEPKRRNDENCAILNVGILDKENHTHYPGYWYPWNCGYNGSDVLAVCTVTVNQCKQSYLSIIYVHGLGVKMLLDKGPSFLGLKNQKNMPLPLAASHRCSRLYFSGGGVKKYFLP